jgi:molybdopterin converting factor small subunit
MRVTIPSPLLSYTKSPEVKAIGATVGDVVDDLERNYPGIRFRMVDEQGAIRRHIRMFLNGTQVRALDVAVRETDELAIVQALSGG